MTAQTDPKRETLSMGAPSSRTRDARSRDVETRVTRDRRVNLGLAVLLASAIVSGLAAQASGTRTGRWLVVAHGVAGLGVLVLARRKSRIAGRSLRRPRRRQGWRLSLVLAALVVLTVLSGVVLTTGLIDRFGPLTVMQLHIGAAVLAVPLAIQHYRRRPVIARTADLDRRNLLRAAAVGALAGGGWLAWERLLAMTGAPGATRRFTGSHERGSGDPAAMPVTQWLDDRVARIDPVDWRLAIGGTEVALADLRGMAFDDVTAVLDCTSGWYAEQVWRGVRLDRLVDPGDAPSIAIRSATGYALRFPARDLDRLWLAFDVGGRPLSPGHGFPARIVAPGRRGFWWVKWVTDISPSSVPWWVQSPFPLT